jgi:hypothetical protein
MYWETRDAQCARQSVAEAEPRVCFIRILDFQGADLEEKGGIEYREVKGYIRG